MLSHNDNLLPSTTTTLCDEYKRVHANKTKPSMKSLLVSLFCLLVCFPLGNSKRSIGRIFTNSDFAYLDRFCFISLVGNVNFEIRYPMYLHDKYGPQSLLFYFDTDAQWASAYQPNKTCDERLSLLHPDQQLILSPYESVFDYTGDHTSSCKVEIPDGRVDEWIVCSGNRGFETARSRWWFMAISNCQVENDTVTIYLDYDLIMTNGPASESWFYQFSADEFYILPVDVAFLCAETLVLITSIIIAQSLRSRNMLHQTFKLFMQSVVLEVMSLACMVGAYGTYAKNGIGLPFVKLVGQLLRAGSETSFIVLLLLIAKGYTITRGRLSNLASWKLTVLICLYLILYMAMFIWQIKVFDPALVIYISESAPGYGIQVLRLISWLSYCLSSVFTVKKYPTKKEFYVVLGVFMTLWFWMGPVTLYLANYLLDDWVREEVVNLVQCSVVLYGFIVFLFLTWPSNSNKNFPFHVRTTQIGDISQPADFPHNAYEMDSRQPQQKEPQANDNEEEPASE